MATHEYRICAVALEGHEQAWEVTVWVRRFTYGPESLKWEQLASFGVDGSNWPNTPKVVWKRLIEAVKP